MREETARTGAARWCGWIGTVAALYGLVLLVVFVGWHAALVGCLIAAGASEATRGRMAHRGEAVK